nr:MAG TPA: hypothetical protein [Bacteriophage sp.]
MFYTIYSSFFYSFCQQKIILKKFILSIDFKPF